MHAGKPSAGGVTCCSLLQCPHRSVRMRWWPPWTPTSTARHKRSPAPSTPSHHPPPSSGTGSWRRSALSAPSECHVLAIFCSLCRSWGMFVLGWGLFGASLIQARYWVQTQWPVKKRLLYLICRLLQAGSAKVIVVGRGEGHPQRGSSSAGMLLSCSPEGHLHLHGVSNAAVCMPFPQIPLWAAGPKLHPKQRKFAVYANYASLWWFFSCAQVLSVMVLFICVKVYLRGSALIDVGEW